jgi:hypothetical protein
MLTFPPLHAPTQGSGKGSAPSPIPLWEVALPPSGVSPDLILSQTPMELARPTCQNETETRVPTPVPTSGVAQAVPPPGYVTEEHFQVLDMLLTRTLA